MIAPFTSVLAVASIFLAIPATATSPFGQKTILYSDHFGNVGENGTYDYVIIGGGTAGLTIAMRLAENESLSVAVIEAGDFYEKDNGNKSVVPAYAFSADVGTSMSSVHLAPLVDWAFVTEPQAAMEGQVYHYPRGKCLGGSSARNVLAYHRGTAGCYVQWATLTGDDSYNFTSLLPYFKKSAHFTPADAAARASNATVPAPHASAFTASGGPLEVSFPPFAMPFSSWGLPALREVGIPTLKDLSSGDLLGAQYSTFTVDPKDGSRSSSESSFLQSAFASERTNLKIYPRSMAKQILFNSKKAATGVRVNTNGAEYILSAQNEVILSGGVFASPQILMVSGIGPRDVLEKYNIPILADRPGVGQNMWDHQFVSITHEIDVLTGSHLNDPVYKAEAEQKYINNATGILTNQLTDVIAFERLPAASRANLSTTALADLSTFASDWPEVEYIIASTAYAGGEAGKDYGTIFAAMVKPLSRGNVSIQSNDTSDHPLINPGWYSNSTDMEVAIQAFRRIRAIWKTKAISGAVISKELSPGAGVETDEEIKAFIITSGATVYHASCTCKMGKKKDPLAVVDAKARVFGVSNLRVVDASAFPILPPGHPQSTVYALAEKIANEILKKL